MDIHDFSSESHKNSSEPPDLPIRKSFKAHRKSHVWRNLLIAGVALVVLGSLGGGGYWYLKRHKKVAPAAHVSTTISSPSTPVATPTSTTTQHYTSNEKSLNLSFDYPSNWTVTPTTTSATDTQPLTIDSTPTTIVIADGSSVTGKVTISIRPGSTPISELASAPGTAPQNSVQFAYKAPTSAQHQYPYLTFIHLSTGSTVAGAFEEIMVTGVQQFTKGNAVTPEALSTLDPIISASFYRCTTTACTGKGGGSISILTGEWQTNAIFKNVQTLLASLKIN